MRDYVFSHYETCYDSEGYMYIKAWYVHATTGARKYCIEQ